MAQSRALRTTCDCRKPRPGPITRAAADLVLDLSRSFTIGDRLKDVEPGRAAATRTVLVRVGYGAADEKVPNPGATPHAVADNFD
ncbi:MAG: HAD hydrolase-like protein [Acidobacteriota bacterium]|nr:HAD hydrolase-like protein [Acidobacteriota bacterium]